MYDENLDHNLKSLVNRIKSFLSKPQPAKRTHINKSRSSEMIPFGISAYEDKSVQGVMANILEAIYEPNFKNFSCGFRTNIDSQKAMKRLDEVIITKKTGFAVDSGIKGFFDILNQEWLIRLA